MFPAFNDISPFWLFKTCEYLPALVSSKNILAPIPSLEFAWSHRILLCIYACCAEC